MYLEHHGILGMKWGVRRFQNPDGSLTEAGKRRYFNKNGYTSYDGYEFQQTEAGKRTVEYYRNERKTYFDEAASRSEVKTIIQKAKKEYKAIADATNKAYDRYYKSAMVDDDYDPSTYDDWIRARTRHMDFVQRVTDDIVSIIGPAPAKNGFTMYDLDDVDEIMLLLERANKSSRSEDDVYSMIYHDPID